MSDHEEGSLETTNELLGVTAQPPPRDLVSLEFNVTDHVNITEHLNWSMEKNATDEWGLQGGQNWTTPTAKPTFPPTKSPTPKPSISPSSEPSVSPTLSPINSPTNTPTFYPTLRGEPHVLRGAVFYDRNANGVRDSNVQVPGMGNDVEYSHGLGGVTIQLVECDETGAAMAADDFAAMKSRGLDLPQDARENSYASTISLGYDVKMRSHLADRLEQGGT